MPNFRVPAFESFSVSAQRFGGNLARAIYVTRGALFGRGVLFAFILAQVADGLLTYLGIRKFGIGIEGNPLVAWYVVTFGAGVALVGAKGLAVACGATLYLRAMHRTIGALTLMYLTAAVWPWLQMFSGAIAP